jgi:hypothetical protein
VRGLHGGDAAVLGGGGLDELLGATLLRAAEIKVIAHEQEDRRLAGELASAEDRVAVTERSGLLDELKAFRVRAGGGGVGGLIAGADDRRRSRRCRPGGSPR